MYWSDYRAAALAAIARRLALERARGADSWCVFDNTAAGRAMPNALALCALTGAGRLRT
jgi:uncharacterized protein YecE (DUF72 family)